MDNVFPLHAPVGFGEEKKPLEVRSLQKPYLFINLLLSVDFNSENN